MIKQKERKISGYFAILYALTWVACLLFITIINSALGLKSINDLNNPNILLMLVNNTPGILIFPGLDIILGISLIVTISNIHINSLCKIRYKHVQR